MPKLALYHDNERVSNDASFNQSNKEKKQLFCSRLPSLLRNHVLTAALKSRNLPCARRVCIVN